MGKRGPKRITYEDLDIRRDGSIYYNGIPRKFWKQNQGYLATSFDYKNFLVHRLVAEKYIPNPKNKRTVNHIDGNKHNNRVENLEWSTYSENNKHAFDTGLNCNKYKRKLTMKEVSEIREKYVPRKYTLQMLADEYDVSLTIIYNIIHNKHYLEEV